MNKISLALLPIMLVLALTGCGTDKEYVNVGPNWAALHNTHPNKDSFPVMIQGTNHAKLGDNLSLSIYSGREGYLWLLQVDPNDTLSLLYPNRINKDNRIAADQWQVVPGKGHNWALEAMKPTGNSILMAIVSTAPSDIDTVLNALNNPQGDSEKTLRAVAGNTAWGLAKHIIAIEE